MSESEQRTAELLRAELIIRNCYRFVDRTNRPTYAEYVKAKAANRQRIRQFIYDLRWIRDPVKTGVPPLIKKGSSVSWLSSSTRTSPSSLLANG